MYNRDLVYDQDFNVKNNITVAPEQTDYFHPGTYGNLSFSDPFISTNTFTIESNITSTMTAGEAIILKPGFTATTGCTFTAHINPSSCTDGQRVANPENNLPPAVVSAATNNEHSVRPATPVFQNNLTIAPNPFNGTTNIIFSLEKEGKVSLRIVNELGQEVFSQIQEVQTDAGNYAVPFDGNRIGKGVYFCMLQIDGVMVEMKKMVVY